MRKIYFSIAASTLGLMCLPFMLYGHTINQHLEELYGDVYLPFFIVAKLLPFIAIGTLAFNPSSGKKQFQIKWFFLLSLLIGVTLALFISGTEFTMMANNVGVLVCGFVLLFSGYNTYLRITSIFVLMGITIGIENGGYIRNANDFIWLFILILIFGVALFIILNNIQFIGHPKRNALRFGTSLFLILSGLTLILLT